MPRKEDTRRRTGCLHCKEKHLRCTEEQPSCRRCETLGLQCTRDLRLTFREDAIQRGLAFGREGVWTKRPSKVKSQKRPPFQPISLRHYINRWIFLNVAVYDFQNRDPAIDTLLESCSPEEHELLTAAPFLLPSYHTHPLHAFSKSDAYLLDYFIQGISPSCSLSPAHNPYVSLVIPLSFSSDILRNALLAVAANQLCLIGRPELRQEACYYKDKALHGLRRQIAVNNHDEGTVATVLMLCFQDISDGCSPSWLTHLRGGMQLLDCDASICRASPSLWGFFRMYFVAHDIMSRTAFGDWSDVKDELRLWADGDDLEEIDVLMGCSRGLMSLIHRISVLASTKAKIFKDRPLTAAEAEYFAAAMTDLHQALLSLNQTLPAHSLERDDLKQIAHIKHLAAQLYLTERLGPSGNIPQQKPLQSPPQNQTQYSTKATLVKSLITSITALTDQLTFTTTYKPANKNTNLATLLWPLFILGNASLENEEHRRFVLDRLLGIQKARNLGSVRRTIEAVKYVFGVGGLDIGFGVGNGTANGRGREGVGWGSDRWRGISLA